MLSREIGVSAPTLSKWLRLAEDAPFMVLPPGDGGDARPCKRWTLAEKLRVLSTAEGLSEKELGAFLREEGVHPEELRTWRDSLDESRVDRSAQRRIQALERELRRKEKALAEAAALLMLKKKAQELGLLGDEDDDTDASSES